MLLPDINDYLQEIETTDRFTLIKLEFLRQEDETPQSEVASKLRLDGGLNIKNRNGVRRTMNMSLDNVLGEYFPSLDSGIWMFQKVKVYLGLLIDGEEFYLPQGILVHDNPTVGTDGSTRINANDKFALLDGTLGGELDTDTIIPAGTTVGTAYRSLMSISQDPKDPIIETGLESETLPYDLIHETGSTIGAMLEEIAFAFSANTFYNEEGFLVLESDISDADKGSIHDFDADSNSETNYQNGSTQYKFSDVYNSCKVIGDNINGTIVQATVKNEDLTSDTSIPNVGFERTLVVKDNIIYTVALCEERAKYEIKRATGLLTQSRINSVSLFHLDVDKVVTITDSRLNFDKKRVLIDSINIPFNTSSSMGLTVVDTFNIDA